MNKKQKLLREKKRVENALELAINDADFNLQESLRGDFADIEDQLQELE